MKRKITGILLLLGLSLVLALWGCAAKPEEQAVSGSFVESEVPTPRLVYTARAGGKMRDLYYIPLSEELADMCREALDDPQKEKVEPLETVQLFQVELDKDQSFTVFETLSGSRFFSAGAVSGVKADEAVEALLNWAEKATGEPCNTQLRDFKAAVSAKLLRNGEELWSARTPEELDRLSALLDAYQGSTVSNFDNYDYTLCCTLEDGTELSLYLSSDEGYIFVPPFRYYKLPQESPRRKDGWLQVFGWEEWPGENDYTSAGAALRDAMDQAEAEKENIAARYKDKTVSWTEVDYAKETAFLHDESYQTTDKEIVDHLLRGMILVEMAEERGLAATEDEIEDLLDNTRRAYEIPEGKEMIDAYCQGLKLSFEEYLELLRSQAYETISMQKMRDQMAKELCEKYDIEYEKDRLPEKVETELEAVLDALVDEHSSDIEYFLER